MTLSWKPVPVSVVSLCLQPVFPPIFVNSRMSGPPVVRTHGVTDWDDFRTPAERLVLRGTEISSAVCTALSLPTGVVTLAVQYPKPDVNCLKIRAVPIRAH